MVSSSDWMNPTITNWKHALADVLREGGIPITANASEATITALINDQCLVESLPPKLLEKFRNMLYAMIWRAAAGV